MAIRNIHGMNKSNEENEKLDKDTDNKIKSDKNDLTSFAKSFPEWDICPPDNLIIRRRR